MSSRVVGASLALLAAALLAVPIATPLVLPAELSLLAGHPTIKGHTLELQDVYVGFYGAELCNTGGDGTCRSRDPQTSFRLTALGELGVSALLGAAALVLALLTLRKSERRKSAALVVRLVALLAAAGAGALIYLGPTDEGTIPIGLGMWLYGAGVVGALLASFLAARPPPPIKLRVAGHGMAPVASLRPMQPATADAGSGPRERSVPPSSSDFPGASDMFPKAADKPRPPAQQLRPLYDAEPQQGGTGGLLPPGMRAVPNSRDSFNVAGEIPPTPPLPERAKPKTLPPPLRSKPPSVAPPIAGEVFAPPPPPPPAATSFTGPAQIVPASGSSGELSFPGPTTAVLPHNQASTLAPLGPPPPPLPSAAMQIPIGPAPRTQVSLVPPMPDHDPPIAPPTAQIARFETPASASDFESSSFPRVVETPPPTPMAPLAPPPPIAPAPAREAKPTRPPMPPMRANVPMPARPGRSTSIPIRPPAPTASAPRTIPPPRPTISNTVPPPPAIPGIPPIPAIPAIPALPRRPETDVTDITNPLASAAHDDVDQPTVARVAAEIADNDSKTNVSYNLPGGEDIETPLDPAGISGDLDGLVTGGHPRLRRSDFNFELDTPATAPPSFASNHALEEAVTVRAPPKSYPSSLPTVPFAAVLPPSDAPELPTTAFRDRLGSNVPLSTAPDSLPPPKDSKLSSGPSPACPQCESPMAWVEEHLRFYCKSCRMYF